MSQYAGAVFGKGSDGKTYVLGTGGWDLYDGPPLDDTRIEPLRETPEPTKAGEQPVGLGEKYTKYIGGPANDFVKDLVSLGNPKFPEVAKDLIAGMIAPRTLTQAITALGTLAMPEAKMAEVVGSEARNAPTLAPILKRLLYPSAGGAVGGLAEKGDPKDMLLGGILGTTMGIQGEASSTARAWLAKSRLGQRFFKEDPERVGKVVSRLVQEFPATSTPKEFGEAFWGTAAQDKLSEMYDRELTAISGAIPKTQGNAIKIGGSNLTEYRPQTGLRAMAPANLATPAIQKMQQEGIIGPKSDFDSLAQAIRDLRLKGRASDGDPKVTFQGRQAQDYARMISDELGGELGKISPGLAKRYQDMDRRYARGSEMLRYLKQPGVVDEDGRLDMRLLQDQFKEERRVGLEHDFTPDEIKDLSNAMFRGGEPTVSDVIRRRGRGPSLHLREGSGGMPRATMFANLMDFVKGNQYAGRYNLGFPYAGPKAETLGIQRGEFSIADLLAGRKANTLAAPEEEP